MIYVYKDERNTGKFYFQLTVEDLETGIQKRIKKRGFSSAKEAQKAAMLFISEKKNQEYNGLKFEELIDEYIKFKRKRVKATSLQRYERVIRLYIEPFVAGKYVNRFLEKESEDFYSYILDKNLSIKNFNRIIAVFKALFRFAQTQFGLKYNPTAQLEYKKESIKPIDPLDLFSTDEFEKFIDVFNEDTTYEFSIKLFFIFLYFIGARRGETKALRWDDIDFENKLVRIDEQAIDKVKNYQVYFSTELKTPQSFRKIPIDDTSLNLLRHLKELRIDEGDYKITDIIFQRNKNKLPLSDSTIQFRNRKYSELAGVKYINIHAFRHSYASNLLSIGVPITVVSEVLGHSNIGVTQKVYIHVIRRDKEIMFTKLNELRNM